MSTVIEKVTDEIKPLEYSQEEMWKRRPSGKNPYKPQVSTKIKWALEEAVDRRQEAQKQLDRIWEWIEEQRQIDRSDITRLARLGTLDHALVKLNSEMAKLDHILMQAQAESKTDKKAQGQAQG